MDPATLLGILLAFGAIIAMIFLEGGSVMSILLPAPMISSSARPLRVGMASGTVKDLGLVVQAPAAGLQGQGRLAPKPHRADPGLRREGRLAVRDSSRSRPRRRT